MNNVTKKLQLHCAAIIVSLEIMEHMRDEMGMVLIGDTWNTFHEHICYTIKSKIEDLVIDKTEEE